jgi:hypothetical protein
MLNNDTTSKFWKGKQTLVGKENVGLTGSDRRPGLMNLKVFLFPQARS